MGAFDEAAAAGPADDETDEETVEADEAADEDGEGEAEAPSLATVDEGGSGTCPEAMRPAIVAAIHPKPPTKKARARARQR